jgi:hypothetical protein
LGKKDFRRSRAQRLSNSPRRCKMEMKKNDNEFGDDEKMIMMM